MSKSRLHLFIRKKTNMQNILAKSIKGTDWFARKYASCSNLLLLAVY